MEKIKECGYCDHCGATGNKSVVKRCYSCGKHWVNPELIKKITLALLMDEKIKDKISILDAFIKMNAFSMNESEKTEFMEQVKKISVV